jgi:glycerol-1-phosphatase
MVEQFDLVVLDLDGVVYIGPDVVPGAAEAIAATARLGVRSCFLTNNASRTPDQVAEHLIELSVPAIPDDVVTSAQVAAALLAERLTTGSRVLVVGGLGLKVALTGAGLVPVDTMADQPVAVVQGFSPDLNWRLLAEGTHAVRSGLLWVASNLDLTVPTPNGPAPGNGSLVQVVSTAAGRRPDLVAGKPQPEPFRAAAHRYASRRPLVVGDRLDTDIEGGCAAGMPGLAVLTGVSGASDLLAAPAGSRPAFLGRDLSALLEGHPEVWVAPGAGPAGVRAECNGAAVALDAGSGKWLLEVVAAGRDPLDLLRAGCGAAWAWTDLVRAGAGAPGGDPAQPDVTGVLTALTGLDPALTWAR